MQAQREVILLYLLKVGVFAFDLQISVSNDGASTIRTIEECRLKESMVLGSRLHLNFALLRILTLSWHFAGHHIGTKEAVSADYHTLVCFNF